MSYKRIFLSVIIIVIMVTYCASGVFASAYPHLNAVGITEETLSHKESTDLITRAEFSYIVSKLITADSPWPSDTVFSDVKKEHAYSGEIKLLSDHGIIRGVGDGLFNPEGNISVSAGMKIVLHVLGYGGVAAELGGYPAGYELLANDLGLYEDLNSEGGMLTKEAAFRLIYNALLTSDGSKNTTLLGDGKVIYNSPDKDDVFLTTRLGFSVYRGEIIEADTLSLNIGFRVDKNEFKSNQVLETEGNVVRFPVADGIDIGTFLHAPVLIWVDENDEVVYIDSERGCEILYGYVDSVNRDLSEENAYQVSKLNYLTLADDPMEYDVSEDVSVWYNRIKTTTDVKLCGRFAKLVLKSGEVVSVSSWDMSEGGLITEVDTTKGIITYIQAEAGTRKIKEMKDTKLLSVNIDGRSADFKEIKPNSVFNYYKSDDETVIAISEQTSIGVLKTVSEADIKIDTITYGKKTCYFSIDGVEYINNAYSNLLGREVCVFFGPNHKAMFVCAETQVEQKPEFYGAVVGVEGKTLEDESDLCLWVLAEDIYKDTFILTEKTKYHDGLSVDILKNNSRKTDGSGVYYFTADSEKRIKEVKMCKPFSGYGDTCETTVNSFVEGNIPYVVLGDKVLYFKGSNIVGLYEGENGFTAKKIQWSNVAGLKVTNNINLKFYGEKETPYPEIVVMTDNLSAIRTRAVSFGVVMDKAVSLNESGEIVNRITLLTAKGNKEYDLTDDLVNKLYEGAFISYYDGKIFADDEIELKSIYNLSGNIDSWNTDNTNTYGLQKGVVRKIDEARLYVDGDNGEAIWFIHPSLSFSMSVEKKADGNQFEQIMQSDIGIGDTVYYFIHSGDIRVIIDVK